MRDIIKKEGFAFAFDPAACTSCNGACCRGESGYVWISSKEIESIASYLNIPVKRFIDEYLVKVGYRWSLRELKRQGEHFCVFFEKGCSIYPVRPSQCRSYPFWDRYRDKKNISEVCAECKGILPDFS